MAKIMTSAATIRRQIEAILENKIPSALTPAPKIRSAVHPTGIEALDELLHGGFHGHIMDALMMLYLISLSFPIW